MPEISMEGLARLRGEALAARMLAGSLMRYLLATSDDPKEVLKTISSYVDATLNQSGTANGGPLDEVMRETARRLVDEDLAAMARSIPR